MTTSRLLTLSALGALAASCIPAAAYEVVLLRPNAYLAENPERIGDASKFLGRARALLGEVGLRHHTINEDAALEDGFPEGEFLLCAYNPNMPRDVADAVADFLDDGGHALFCFYLTEALCEKLGLAPLEYTPAGDDELMEYVATGAEGKKLPGQPTRVLQSSWNAHLTEGLREDVRVAGRWLAADRKTSPGGALFVGPEAAFLGHVFTEGDTARKAALLTSVVSHYQPGTWDLVAERALQGVFDFRHAPGLEGMRELCDRRYDRKRLGEIDVKLNRIAMLRAAGRSRKAFQRAQALRAEAERLYISALPTRKRELRGAWVVMPGGVGDWGWEKTARVAKRNGLTDLFVRVEWRGIAHYKSKVLRQDEDVEAGADPLAECLEACHKHGLKVHAWFINHNWRTPPEDLIKEFSEAGRWQFGPDGQDRVLEGGQRVYWVNPSDPRNVKLQADMMSEVAREYRVDGVHFDYIRYENYSGSYGKADRARFEADTGLEVREWPGDVLRSPRGRLNGEFLEWRVQQVSSVVEACSEAVREANPECKLSAAVYPAWPNHRLIVGQDWPEWLEEGWIDFVCPMNYDAPSYYSRHEGRVLAQREAAGGYPLYSGIGAWLQPSAIDVADQVVTDRNNGADGILFFSLTEQFATEVLPKLRRGPLK